MTKALFLLLFSRQNIKKTKLTLIKFFVIAKLKSNSFINCDVPQII